MKSQTHCYCFAIQYIHLFVVYFVFLFCESHLAMNSSCFHVRFGVHFLHNNNNNNRTRALAKKQQLLMFVWL